MVSLLLPIIYVAFISLGLPDSLLGSAWPSMYPQLGVPVSYAGIISMIISLGTIISSLNSDRLTRALGTGKVTAISVGMTAAALFGFSVSGQFWMLCLWAIPYGLGAGSVDALREPPYELAALYVGHRHHDQPHGHGCGAGRRNAVDVRLPVHCPVPDPSHGGAVRQSAPVAETHRGHFRRRSRPHGPDLRAGAAPAGRKRSDALFLLLLRAGNNGRSVGQQLSDPVPRPAGQPAAF